MKVIEGRRIIPALIVSLVLCFTMTFTFADTASAATVKSKVKNSKIKTLLLKNCEDLTVELFWSKATKYKNLNKYRIYRSTKKNKGFKAIKTVKFSKKSLKSKTLTYCDTSKALDEMVYYYKVRGVKKIRGKNVFTKYSPVKKVKCTRVESGNQEEPYNDTKEYNVPDPSEAEGATDVEYYTKTEEGKTYNTGVKSFKRYDPQWGATDSRRQKLFYYNTNTNAQGQASQVTPEVIKDILTKNDSRVSGGSIWNRWANIADSIYASGGNTSCISNDYTQMCKGKDSELLDLPTDMKRLKGGGRGDIRNDSAGWTGPRIAYKLSAVRDYMAEDIGNHVGGTATEAKNKAILLKTGSALSSDRESDSLPELKSDEKQTVIYSVCTFVDNCNSCFHYDYGSYAIAFHDFKLVPIADKNIKLITDYGKYNSAEEAKAKGVPGITYDKKEEVSELKSVNDSLEKNKASFGVTINKSETIGVTNIQSSSVSYGTGFKVGYKTPETVIGSGSVGISFNFNEAFSAATSESKTYAISKAKTTTHEVLVPAHSKVSVFQNDTNYKYSTGVTIPMELTYKVTIAALTGDCYADRVAVFNTRGSTKEHGSLTAQFGMGNENGIDAANSLDLRSKSSASYEQGNEHGQVHRYYHKFLNYSDYKSKTKGLDWNSLKKTNGSDIDSLITNIPIVTDRARMSFNIDQFGFYEDAIKPMYPMSTLAFKRDEMGRPMADKIELAKNDSVAINNAISLRGMDSGKDGQPADYYGFNQAGDGHWVECDVNGVPLTQATGLFSINSNTGRITGLKAGTGYIIWALNDDETIRQKYTVNGKTTVNEWQKDPKSDKQIALNARKAVVQVTVAGKK